MIGNDYFTEVWVKCYWVNAEQEIQDFMFRLTPNQPVWFRASDGAGTGYYDDIQAPSPCLRSLTGYGVVGELKCWAVDAVGENRISFNHCMATPSFLIPCMPLPSSITHGPLPPAG